MADVRDLEVCAWKEQTRRIWRIEIMAVINVKALKNIVQDIVCETKTYIIYPSLFKKIILLPYGVGYDTWDWLK